MRIYAVSDIHGKESRIEIVEKTVRDVKPDLLVFPGDIVGFPERERALSRLGGLGVEAFAVKGNAELFMSEAAFFKNGIQSLDFREIEKDGVKFVGASGAAPLPFHTRVRLRERGLGERLSKLVDTRTILVVHPPPYGSRDEVMGAVHAGSRLVRAVVDRRRPAAVLCGHIHEAAGATFCGETLVVNCSFYKKNSGALVEIDEKTERLDVEFVA